MFRERASRSWFSISLLLSVGCFAFPGMKGEVCTEQGLCESGLTCDETSQRCVAPDCVGGKCGALGSVDCGGCQGSTEICESNQCVNVCAGRCGRLDGFECGGCGRAIPCLDNLCAVPMPPGMTWIRSMPAGVSFTKSEVTVRQYEACVTAGPCAGTYDMCNFGSALDGENPMNCVDWNGASTFCGWIGARLPTEEEWFAEASARGPYPWGGDPASCSLAVMFQAGSGCGRGSTSPVCSRPAGNSVSGLCDMVGNVWEWTSTPVGSGRGVRGGGWIFSDASDLSAAGRFVLAPSRRANDVGFRCVRNDD